MRLISIGAILALTSITAFVSVSSRDVGEAAVHGKNAVKEAKLAADALKEGGEHRSFFHLPRWARRDETETGFNNNDEEEEDEETMNLLQRTIHSMKSFGKTIGLSAEDEMDDETAGLGLDYQRTRPSYMEEGGGQSLGHRLVNFFNLTRRFRIHDEECDDPTCSGFGNGLKEQAREMSHELQKELGLEKKTLGDKLADVAESLHLKEPSSEKAAAKKVAETFERSKEGLEALQAQAGGKVDALLKTLHIRSPSTLEKVGNEYNYALHRIKVSSTRSVVTTPAAAFAVPLLTTCCYATSHVTCTFSLAGRSWTRVTHCCREAFERLFQRPRLCL
jgi:hypothetical protein